MPDNGLRDVAVISRLAFALIAALAGWVVAWSVACAYFAIMPAIRHLPRYPTPPGIALVYAICTLGFVLAVTLVFGLPYVAIRTTAGMLQRPWRFYVETGLAGVAAITGYMVLYRPEAESLSETLRFGLPLYGGFSLATSTVTSLVFLGWLRWQGRRSLED